MYLTKDITRKCLIAYAGDPVEIITMAHKPAILIKCRGVKLAVGESDLTSVKPVKRNKS